jgi:hypothetical protein
MGRYFWGVAIIMWFAALVGHWFTSDEFDPLFMLCAAIGLMIISNRMIEDGKKS